MEEKINILKPFFEEPRREFHIRELARIINVNHTTVRKYLNQLVEEKFLEKNKGKVYHSYRARRNKKFLNLKLYFNLEKLRKSRIINDLESEFDFSPIVIFGTYASANDTSDSDIDICIITNINKEFDSEKYEKELNREISIHLIKEKELNKIAEKNPELINSICNGIVVSGEIEIIK